MDSLCYIAYVCIPSQTASSIHIMRMCNAFANSGVEVCLISSIHGKSSLDNSKVFSWYNVKENFRMEHHYLPKFLGSRLINSFLIARKIKVRNFTYVYSRDIYVSAMLTLLGCKVSHEFHNIPRTNGWVKHWLIRRMYRSKDLRAIFTITQYLGRSIKEVIPAGKRITVVPDAANIPSTSEVEPLIGEFKVGYIGSLMPGKGMEVISRITPFMPDVTFHVVGGHEKDIKKWQSIIGNQPNVIFHPFQSQAEISRYINAMDICLLPNQEQIFVGEKRNTDIGQVTSPMKMFEYMAHRKAIIASDLPVLKEILHTGISQFCLPDDTKAWVDKIRFLQQHPEERRRLGENAYKEFLSKYTWKKRAENILHILAHSA